MQLVVASALFWSWFDTAVFRPTFMVPFATSSNELYGGYVACALACGVAPLLLATLRPHLVEPQLSRGSWWVAVTATSTLGGAMAALGASMGSPALVILAAAVVGICCGCYQLSWARWYAERGARSAVSFVSLSIALGALLDFSILGLPPMVGLVLTACLPLISLAVLLMSPEFREVGSATTGHAPAGEQANEASDGRGPALSLDLIFEGSRHRALGLSIPLVLSFLIYGFSFGYDQFIAIFSGSLLDTAASDALLVSRGAVALVIFLAVRLLPSHMYAIFRVGILVGIAGCVLSPSIEGVLGTSVLTSPIIAIGYATFDIITWVLLSEIAFQTRSGVSATVGPGHLLIHAGEAIGYVSILAMSTSAGTSNADLLQTFGATVGYLMIVAEMLLLEENSALWILIRTSVSTGEDALPAPGEGGSLAWSVQRLAADNGLTDREADVLRLLAIGRSRPRIAETLGISESTVGTHVQQIYRKLGVHSRQELLDLLS